MVQLSRVEKSITMGVSAMSGAKKFRSTPKIVNKSGLECTTSGLIRTAVTKLELISKRSAGVVCSQEFPDSVFSILFKLVYAKD